MKKLRGSGGGGRAPRGKITPRSMGGSIAPADVRRMVRVEKEYGAKAVYSETAYERRRREARESAA